MDSTRPTASTPRVREPIPADQASFSTGLKGMRMGYTEETEAQEDWLAMATADPAFWLRGSIVNEKRTA